MTLEAGRLAEIVHELTGKPGHEKVRSLVYVLLTDGLGADSAQIHFERQLPEVRGRMDAFLGRTVLEFKSNLDFEQSDAEEKLARYLGQRERETGQRYLGVATDGALFLTYELRGSALHALGRFGAVRDTPQAVLTWLDSVVVLTPELTPDHETVRRELGKNSLPYAIARDRLLKAWAEVRDEPGVALKRKLWDQLMEMAYGSAVEDDELFIQHTYLTVVAKTMATRVLGAGLPGPCDLMSGRVFSEVGITGAVESDFFDWVLDAPEGENIVARVASHADRFRLTDVEQDVLKGLYESLVDPSQRHDLGEYYTPDWLAARICREAVADPLVERVLDPACGSGTFLFHAVRNLLSAADAAVIDREESLQAVCRQVIGVDVHPVAVIIARVTYLLAVGEERLRERRSGFTVPVYLGDSLQWHTKTIMGKTEVRVAVPEGPDLFFPWAVTHDPTRFDAIVSAMFRLIEDGSPREAYVAWLRATKVDEEDAVVLGETYEHLRDLHASGRNHIWAYVVRNLARPIWLSSPEERPNVLIGNPPWLAYSFMSRAMRTRFRDAAKELGVWEGARGRVSHQDLSAYFFARCVELYLQPSGRIAFVMPMAALSRTQFASFRTGLFATQVGPKRKRDVRASVRFTAAWSFDDSVQPLFPVPSCVLFATEGASGSLPEQVKAFAGQLPRRDAHPEEVAGVLAESLVVWPTARDAMAAGPYAGRFRQGAIIVPRVLFVVRRIEAGALGTDPALPLVESARSAQEKEPWRHVTSLRGNVEARFIRPLYVGASVAPFRLLGTAFAVIPCESDGRMYTDSEQAQGAGNIHLARWLQNAEQVWGANTEEAGSIVERLDFSAQLKAQFPVANVRVLFSKSGALPAAAVSTDTTAVVDHKLYWGRFGSLNEAHYVCGVLNSEEARCRVEHLQSRGQWGARDFDKVMLSLPIPPFDSAEPLHRQLARAAKWAAAVAGTLAAEEPRHFTQMRKQVRALLEADGVANDIEELVRSLLETA